MNATDDLLDEVRRHYAPASLVERLREALRMFGPEETRLTPAQLAPLDHFHTRGVAATADLARLAGVSEADRVLDLGSGIGGPARFLAATAGCAVQGLDLSPEFTEAARYLTGRTGQEDRVRFETGDATRTPFAEASFDVVVLQHVVMNIADRPALYREIRRVLRPGGRFATYDVVRRSGEPDYPVPWARTPAVSTLLSEAETLASVAAAGFALTVKQDDSQAATAFFQQIAASGLPPGPSLGLVVGPDFRLLIGNLSRAVGDGRVGVLGAVFEAR